MGINDPADFGKSGLSEALYTLNVMSRSLKKGLTGMHLYSFNTAERHNLKRSSIKFVTFTQG